jgi:hypothetical protein
MNKLAEMKQRTHAFLISHEQAMTITLLVLAGLLILVALKGKPHHKAAACLYIVL